MRRYVLLLTGLFAIAPLAQAQKSEKQKEAAQPKDDRNIVVIVDMITVHKADAFWLVRMDSTTLWNKVTEMVKAGTAKSEFLSGVTTRAGERCIIECIEELRYPTEFEPHKPVDPKNELPSNPSTPQDLAVDATAPGLAPTAFETRNIGSILEVMPRARADNKIDLELIPSSTLLDRFDFYPIGGEKSEWRTEQPIFHTFKVQTQVTIPNGKPIFIGTGGAEPAGKGKSVDQSLLFFVTATILE